MRKLFGMLMVIMLALVLVACGEEEDEPEPTAEETVPAVSTEADEEPTIEDVTEAVDAGSSTPASSGTPSGASTPAVLASPIVGASPAASPVAATPESGSAVVAAPAGNESPGAMLSLSGSVILPGAENETFILTDSGCVGLGEHSDVQEGRQIVVRDETGAIIGVTTLESSDGSEGCTWDFALDVPESEFYSVSIPMVTEYVFTSEEVEQGDGAIAMSLS